MKELLMGWTCSLYVEERNAYVVLVGELLGRRQLGKARSKWEDNVKG
jgi:hypothetical protein